jgi:hypothetical protein
MRSAPPHRRPALFAAALFALALCVPPAAFAAWPPGGQVLPLPPGVASQWPARVCRDGGDGVFVVTTEQDSGGLNWIRLRHRDGAGEPGAGWTQHGVIAAGTAPSVPLIEPDGAGGVVLVWSEFTTAWSVYAKRFTAAGEVAPGWPPGGVLVTTMHPREAATAVADGAGGVVVAWLAPSTGAPGVHYQHLLGSGVIAGGFTAAGRSLTSSLPGRTAFRWPTLAHDGTAGFWLSYTGIGPDSVYAPSEYRVARLMPSGLPDADQQPGGVVLPVPASRVLGDFGYGQPVALAPDGAGGTVVFAFAGSSLVGFHLLDTPEIDPAWPETGAIVATGVGGGVAALYPALNWPAATGDGAGGAYVGWGDPADNRYARATRVLADGSVAPGWEGGAITGGSMYQQFVADAAGVFAAGAFPLSCPHYSCYGTNTLARFDTAGGVAAGWPGPSPDLPGYLLSGGPPEAAPRLCGDGADGVYALWFDQSEHTGLRLGRWVAAGPLGVAPSPAPAGLALSRARFEPGAGVRVDYALPGSGAAALELFDVAGRRHARERLAASAGSVTLAGTRALEPGLYFVRLAAGPRFVVAKVGVAR